MRKCAAYRVVARALNVWYSPLFLTPPGEGRVIRRTDLGAVRVDVVFFFFVGIVIF